MTHDEYNALTDEEQNALVATEVLGWEHGTFLASIPAYFEDGEYVFNARAFDPKHNLDHAFMLVDKLKDEIHDFALAWNMFQWFCTINIDMVVTHPTSPNEAIMLACLKAKGVVE